MVRLTDCLVLRVKLTLTSRMKMTNMQPNFTVEEENEALISFLRADYDDALEQIRVLKSDVNELIDILRKHSIEVPVHIQERIQLDTPLE